MFPICHDVPNTKEQNLKKQDPKGKYQDLTRPADS